MRPDRFILTDTGTLPAGLKLLIVPTFSVQTAQTAFENFVKIGKQKSLATAGLFLYNRIAIED